MVVAIHSNVYYLSFRDGSARWFVAMELTALCVISVPLFFMVSGAVNIGREETITFKELFCRKIPKQFIPFVNWSIIYVVTRMAMGKITVSVDGFISLLWEPAYYQFWFMYSLLAIYLCIPVFQFLLQKADKKILQYILVVWLIGSVFFPLGLRYIPRFRISEHFDLIFLEGYWGYFFLGGYLRKYRLKNSKKLGRILMIAGVTTTGVASAVEWLFTDPQKYYGYVYGAYLLPGAVMATVGVFLLLSEVEIQGKNRERILYISGLSMGVYYVHTLVIGSLEVFFVEYGIGVGIAIIKWLLACSLSAFITAIIQNMKCRKGLLLN